MLGKLIKYDLKANRNVFLLMYGILLAVALGTRFTLSDWIGQFDESIVVGLISAVLMFTYVMGMIALNVLCIVLIVRRFYTNLFGSEGYLSFTLPVTATEHFFGKVISAVILYVSSIAVQVISVLILLVGTFDFEVTAENQYLIDSLKGMFGDMISAQDIILQGILTVAELLGSLLLIYFAVCLGQMFRRHRVIASIGIYFGLNAVINTISNLIAESFFTIRESGWSVYMEFESGYYVVSVLFLVLRLVGFAAGSILIMKKKLNLE